MSEAVERGVQYGVHRAFKYAEKPSPEAIIEQVEQAVLNEICQWFDFDGNGHEQGDG